MPSTTLLHSFAQFAVPNDNITYPSLRAWFKHMYDRFLQVMVAYCKKQGVSTSELRFLGPDGVRLNAEHTALDLELEDKDQ
jgi:hypothetical protein